MQSIIRDWYTPSPTVLNARQPGKRQKKSFKIKGQK